MTGRLPASTRFAESLAATLLKWTITSSQSLGVGSVSTWYCSARPTYVKGHRPGPIKEGDIYSNRDDTAPRVKCDFIPVPDTVRTVRTYLVCPISENMSY